MVEGDGGRGTIHRRVQRRGLSQKHTCTSARGNGSFQVREVLTFDLLRSSQPSRPSGRLAGRCARNDPLKEHNSNMVRSRPFRRIDRAIEIARKGLSVLVFLMVAIPNSCDSTMTLDRLVDLF